MRAVARPRPGRSRLGKNDRGVEPHGAHLFEDRKRASAQRHAVFPIRLIFRNHPRRGVDVDVRARQWRLVGLVGLTEAVASRAPAKINSKARAAPPSCRRSCCVKTGIFR
jgi:hypothetical protein